MRARREGNAQTSQQRMGACIAHSWVNTGQTVRTLWHECAIGITREPAADTSRVERTAEGWSMCKQRRSGCGMRWDGRQWQRRACVAKPWMRAEIV